MSTGERLCFVAACAVFGAFLGYFIGQLVGL